jgi:hypothetical protein
VPICGDCKLEENLYLEVSHHMVTWKFNPLKCTHFQSFLISFGNHFLYTLVLFIDLDFL